MRILWKPFFNLPELAIIVKTWRPWYRHFNKAFRWGRWAIYIVDRDFLDPLLDE